MSAQMKTPAGGRGWGEKTKILLQHNFLTAPHPTQQLPKRTGFTDLGLEAAQPDTDLRQAINEARACLDQMEAIMSIMGEQTERLTRHLARLLGLIRQTLREEQ